LVVGRRQWLLAKINYYSFAADKLWQDEGDGTPEEEIEALSRSGSGEGNGARADWDASGVAGSARPEEARQRKA
jgi:hypothetical protein